MASSGRPQCRSAPPASDDFRVNTHPSTRRTSAVVDTVEAIRQKRIDRRINHDLERTEKARLRNMEPGNPNWDYAHLIRQEQQFRMFRPLTPDDYLFRVSDVQIRVCIRKRPLSPHELKKKDLDVVTVLNPHSAIVHDPDSGVTGNKFLHNHMFYFDCVMDQSCTNEVVYRMTAQPLIETIFKGGMATCFAYGQTGSGKTHTMGGDFNSSLKKPSQNCKKGIYAMAARDVFSWLERPDIVEMNLYVACSFFEIYGGKIYDLLNSKNRLAVLEDGKQKVVLVNLAEREAYSVEDVLTIIQAGTQARTSGKTTTNVCSSRSHAVFQIILKTEQWETYGKFSFVDLAGNERGVDTSSASPRTRMETSEINKALLSLKECIRAMARKDGGHLPFRSSKLTQVLRDSFLGENSRTCMIAMISPSNNCVENTLNTLRYADRVKELCADSSIPVEDLPETESDPDFDPLAILALESADDEEASPEAADDNNNPTTASAMVDEPQEFELKREVFGAPATLHTINSQLEETEDSVHSEHQTMLNKYTEWADAEYRLLESTNTPTYDAVSYMATLDRLLMDKLIFFHEIRVKVLHYKTLMEQLPTSSGPSSLVPPQESSSPSSASGASSSRADPKTSNAPSTPGSSNLTSTPGSSRTSSAPGSSKQGSTSARTGPSSGPSSSSSNRTQPHSARPRSSGYSPRASEQPRVRSQTPPPPRPLTPNKPEQRRRKLVAAPPGQVTGVHLQKRRPRTANASVPFR